MKSAVPIGCSVLLLALNVGGCAPLWIASGAAIGYAAGRDSAVLDLDRPWNAVWDASREEIQHQGLIKREDAKRGRIDAKVEETDVVLTVKQLTPSTVRVIVRARKNLFPKMEIAQKLSVGIQRRAEAAGKLF